MCVFASALGVAAGYYFFKKKIVHESPMNSTAESFLWLRRMEQHRL